jgi:hypothetical protein
MSQFSHQQLIEMENSRKKIQDEISQYRVSLPQGVGLAKQSFLEKNQTMLIGIGVPLGFYAFSKYKKYDGKKTAKVTIIGSVVVLGLVVLNGFSGAWTGNTIAKRIFGKQNEPKQLGGKSI